MKNYPINYNFGKNWTTQIKPLLDLPKVQRAITRGVNGYLSNWPDNGHRYKKNTPPAQYSSNDGYAQLMWRKEENILEELEKAGKLPERYVELQNTDLEDDDLSTEYFELQQEIVKPYLEWDVIKYNLESYCLFGSCHWTAPTFGLTMARLVEPNEKWLVQSSEKHTTVINKEKTKVFDLLYWCSDGRIENHVFGDKVKKRDKTLGGKNAYLDSLAE